MKVYAVKRGHKTGIFYNWAECQSATNGYSGPEFKSFSTKEEAEAYLEDKDIWKERVAADNEDGYLVAFTDGSYNAERNVYSYGVCLISPDKAEHTICGYGNNSKYIESRNIIGEIFGVINALDWAISNEFYKIKIYHDLNGLSEWISGEWKANVPVTQMFVNLFKGKYEGLLSVEFVKISGHSNISYNDRADELAKVALEDKRKVAIKGANWFSISYVPSSDFEALSELITECDERISKEEINNSNKLIYKFKMDSDIVTVTHFKNGKKAVLVQGKDTYLFQVIIAIIVESYDNMKVEQILGSAYRISIKEDEINKAYEPVVCGLPSDYPNGIRRLIKQSIINIKYKLNGDVDYSQYVFCALRALEGHIKYLLKIAGVSASSNSFSCFNKNSADQSYYVTARLTDESKREFINQCYTYYKSHRDTIFHFGDLIGMTESTRFVQDKDEADEIIQKCLELISTNV